MEAKTIIYTVSENNGKHCWFDGERALGGCLDVRDTYTLCAQDYPIGTQLVMYCVFELKKPVAERYDGDLFEGL